MQRCAACKQDKCVRNYSANQMRKEEHRRRCSDCIYHEQQQYHRCATPQRRHTNSDNNQSSYNYSRYSPYHSPQSSPYRSNVAADSHMPQAAPVLDYEEHQRLEWLAQGPPLQSQPTANGEWVGDFNATPSYPPTALPVAASTWTPYFSVGVPSPPIPYSPPLTAPPDWQHNNNNNSWRNHSYGHHSRNRDWRDHRQGRRHRHGRHHNWRNERQTDTERDQACLADQYLAGHGGQSRRGRNALHDESIPLAARLAMLPPDYNFSPEDYALLLELDESIDRSAKEGTTSRLTDSVHDGHECDPCCICQSSFEAGDSVKTLPCGHEFHSDCICQWLESYNKFCPLCKQCVEAADEQ